jgi:hypothetical protein
VNRIPIEHLDEWLQATFEKQEPILVRAGFRDDGTPTDSTLEILELDGWQADTVRLLIPQAPSVLNAVPDPSAFGQDGGGWWNGWAAILAATGLVPPVIDPERLADLLHDHRRVRLCCDTSALATGVAGWLLLLFGYQADLVTSALVDREIAGWRDKHRDRLLRANSVALWKLRTQHALASRLIQNPPRGVVVDRLAPQEQGALMLAKLRDEFGKKSPDADILHVEMARGLIRDQPRNARVVYLTGDRTNAESAISALGWHNVLFAHIDDWRARQFQGRVTGRGVWRPGGPLGCVVVPTTGQLLWDVLAACSFIILEAGGGRWLLRTLHTVRGGAPSDWVDPWVEIEEFALKTAPSTASGAAWLLPPVEAGPPVDIPPSLRLTPAITFGLIWEALSGKGEPVAGAPDIVSDTTRLLAALGALDESGAAGPHLEEFRRAWYADDLDWFHAEFKRLPGYSRVMAKLQEGADRALHRREERYVSMMRSLGQAARLSSDGPIIVGDAAIRSDLLRAALDRWLPRVGDALPTTTLCRYAAEELRLTPARFEAAMERLWESGAGAPFEGRTGGEADARAAERVAILSPEGFTFRDVGPGVLSFGRSGAVRFIARTT